jgi:hypothetical protein
MEWVVMEWVVDGVGGNHQPRITLRLSLARAVPQEAARAFANRQEVGLTSLTGRQANADCSMSHPAIHFIADETKS